MSAKFFSPVSAVASAPLLAERLLTGVLLAFVLGTSALPLHASEVTGSDRRSGAEALPTNPKNPSSLTDGVYLYGQSPEANHLGSAYMVVKVSNQQVVGAFYMPSSSFDCFQGKVQGEKLALTVVNSYEKTAYPYSVALHTNTAVAASDKIPVRQIVPVGYHEIGTVSENDRRLLATCQANYQ